MNQEWRDVVGYEGLYVVSDTGIVKSNYNRFKRRSRDPEINKFRNDRCLYKKNNRGGYVSVRLFKNKHGKHFLVHRLVAIAFIPNPNNYPEVNHIDGNKLNNNASNLEWCTPSQNTLHSYKIGSQVGLKGESNPSCKIKEYDAKIIIESLRSGMKASEIHKKFGYSNGVIYPIISGKTWKHLL